MEDVDNGLEEAKEKTAKPKRAKKGAGKTKTTRQKIEKRRVEFLFRVPDAGEVWLAGDFNEWDPALTRMKKRKEGLWKATLSLAPGRYEYKVCADGQWVEYIRGVERVPNPFGTENFVMWVD